MTKEWGNIETIWNNLQQIQGTGLLLQLKSSSHCCGKWTMSENHTPRQSSNRWRHRLRMLHHLRSMQRRPDPLHPVCRHIQLLELGGSVCLARHEQFACSSPACSSAPAGFFLCCGHLHCRCSDRQFLEEWGLATERHRVLGTAAKSCPGASAQLQSPRWSPLRHSWCNRKKYDPGAALSATHHHRLWTWPSIPSFAHLPLRRMEGPLPPAALLCYSRPERLERCFQIHLWTQGFHWNWWIELLSTANVCQPKSGGDSFLVRQRKGLEASNFALHAARDWKPDAWCAWLQHKTVSLYTVDVRRCLKCEANFRQKSDRVLSHIWSLNSCLLKIGKTT